MHSAILLVLDQMHHAAQFGFQLSSVAWIEDGGFKSRLELPGSSRSQPLLLPRRGWLWPRYRRWLWEAMPCGGSLFDCHAKDTHVGGKSGLDWFGLDPRRGATPWGGWGSRQLKVSRLKCTGRFLSPRIWLWLWCFGRGGKRGARAEPLRMRLTPSATWYSPKMHPRQVSIN